MDKNTILNWMKSSVGKNIIISHRNARLTVRSRVTDVQLIDACGTHIENVQLASGHEQVQLSIFLHDKSLSLQLEVRSEQDPALSVSMPTSILYEDIILNHAEGS